MRPRVPALLISIFSLLLGLIYAPFFHIHTEPGVLHAHLFDTDPDHDSDSTSGFHADHGEHRASDVPLIAARSPHMQTHFVNFQFVRIIETLMVPAGVVFETPAHGPG